MQNKLHISCEQGDLEAVRRLVEFEQCRLNEPHDQTELCPIYYAARKGHVPIIRYILDRAGMLPDLPGQKYDLIKLAQQYEKKSPNVQVSSLIAGLAFFRNTKEYRANGRKSLESLFLLPVRLTDFVKCKFAHVLCDLAQSLASDEQAEVQSEICSYSVKLLSTLSCPTDKDLRALAKVSSTMSYACNRVSNFSDDVEIKLHFRLKSIQTLKNIPLQYRYHVDDYYEEYSLYVLHLALFLQNDLPLDDPRYMEIARVIKKEYLYVMLHALGKEQASDHFTHYLKEQVLEINRILVAATQKFPNESLDEHDLVETSKRAPAAADSVRSTHSGKRGYPSFHEKPKRHARSKLETNSSKEEISSSSQQQFKRGAC